MRTLLGILSLVCFFVGVFLIILLLGSINAPGNSSGNTVIVALGVLIAFGLAVAFRAYKSRLAT